MSEEKDLKETKSKTIQELNKRTRMISSSEKLKKVRDNDIAYRKEVSKKVKSSIGSIKERILKINRDNVSEKEVRDIIALIDKEVDKCTLRMEYIGDKDNEALKDEADIFVEFNDLNTLLFDRLMEAMPYDTFSFSEDKDRENVLRNFFNKIDKDVSLLDYANIDFSRDAKDIIKEKDNELSNHLIDILEDKLHLTFSDNQKIALRSDFNKVAKMVNDEKMDDLIKECDKIKEVNNLKMVARPSYKNFISKNELKNFDDSHKISTIRIDFVNYITLSKEEKLKVISDNLSIQLKSIKEILEEEKEEYSKKMKLFFMLILLSGAAVTFNPALAATGVIALGSAAAYMQTKVIMADNKIKKIEDEFKNIDDKKSDIVNEAYESLEQTSDELLQNEEYSDIARKYIKKKKDLKRAEEMKRKIEEEFRFSIEQNLDKMSIDKKDRIARKVKNKFNVKSLDKDKDGKDLNFDVQIEL